MIDLGVDWTAVDWTAWGYAGLFLAAFAAAFIVPILPSEPVLLALATQPEFSPALLVIVASVGNTLGSCANWAIGVYVEGFKTRAWFPVSERSMERAERWYRRWGLWSLLFAWLPIVGDPLTFAAGLMRAPFVWFLPLVAIGKTARYAGLIYLSAELGVTTL